jgi:hypothetical protein
MSPNHIFAIVNLIALLSWVLLAVLPRRRWVTDLVAGLVVPALMAIIYSAIIATSFADSPGGFSSLPEVALLFGNPWLLLAGWTHYLAFDLLVGSWEARDAGERRIPHPLLLPCLIVTFLFGPAGWLLYRAVRTVYRGA